MDNTQLSIDNAWQGVALEERIELISRVRAQGTVMTLLFVVYAASVAYGFDRINLLWLSVALALIMMPLSANRHWGKEKAALLLQYLAARSVARRYAAGLKMGDITPVLFIRGRLHDINEDGTVNTTIEGSEPLNWFCLLRSTLIVLTEARGGAKLSYALVINSETKAQLHREDDPRKSGILHITSVLRGSATDIAVSSPYPAALLALQMKMQQLSSERKKSSAIEERLRVG